MRLLKHVIHPTQEMIIDLTQESDIMDCASDQDLGEIQEDVD